MTSDARPGPRAGSVPLVVALGYLLLYVGLDWVSFIHPMRGLNITPWNPQAALAVGLLVWAPRAWWLVWLGLVGAEVAVRGMAYAWPAGLAVATALTLGHALAAAACAHWFRPAPRVATRRHFLLFLSIAVGAALLDAVLYVAALAAFEIPPPGRVLAAIGRAWVGDAVGLLVMLPLGLLTQPERRRRAVAAARSLEAGAIALVAALAAYTVFGQPAENQFQWFYLLFVPVAWAAARFGLEGAIVAAAWVQLLLIAAVQPLPYRPLTVFELQIMMAALAATGLLLGSIVDEREEAQRTLRETLQLAAAGNMAAALAHELNQPLTALSTYARASQLMAQRLQSEHADPLIDVTTRIVHEAGRASEVVTRLRNFFRDRSTELQATAFCPLLDEVMQSQQVRAASLQVRLEWQCAAAMPPLWLDRVQVSVVLRNLVSNAIDAAADRLEGAGTGTVAVAASVDGEQMVLVVLDNGAGVSATQLPRLFEGHASGKPGGMGIGLHISRAIVEAHGGRLWAEPGPGGRFVVSLPLAATA